MKWPILSLSEALATAEVFDDGDWVESKDQDPEGDVRLVQLADVGDGKYINRSDRFLTNAKALKLRCTFLKPGDVMVARMPDPLGRACIFPGDPKRSVTVVDVCIIRPDERKHEARWLMHCLNAPACRHQIAGFATGTTRSRISRGNLGKIKVPLPPLAEQRTIAEVLDRADALRAKRRVALAQLDGVTQSLFLDLFGANGNHGSSCVTAPLGSLCRSINDGVHKTPKYIERGVPFVTVKNIASGELDLTDTKFISEGDHKAFTKRTKPERGDVLVSKDGTIGVPCPISTDAEFSIFVSVALLKPRVELIDQSFLVAQFQSDWVQRQIRAGTKGIAIRHLHLEDFKRLMFIVPPLELQEEFARRVRAVEKLKTAHRASLAELNALFATLQHRAFRGEL